MSGSICNSRFTVTYWQRCRASPAKRVRYLAKQT